MCEFCKAERGECKYLESKDVDIKIGKATLGGSEIGIFIGNREDGTWNIETSLCVGDTFVTEIDIPIKYCPFCGRKLHND